MVMLVLVRHGTTLWSEKNLFAGWGDAPLSPKGEAQARTAGRLLAREGFEFDCCHTSRLSRSQRTCETLLQAMGGSEVLVEAFWQLNERHYGTLQEVNRLAVVERYGNAATVAWRRSYRERPPALEDEDPRWQEQCARFSDLPPAMLPRTESLEDGALRAEPYWSETLVPLLRAGQRVLVVAHTTPIRGLARLLEGLSDEDTAAYRIPTAVPLVYELDDQLAPLSCRRLYGDLKNRWRDLRTRYKPRWISWI